MGLDMAKQDKQKETGQTEKGQGLLGRLFRTWKKEDPISASGLPEGATSYTGSKHPFLPGQGNPGDDNPPTSSGLVTELAQLVHETPAFRQMSYDLLSFMANDATIDSALKMHLSHALSAKTDTGEIVFIESVSDAEDPIVNDLRDTFKDLINRDVSRWAYQAALFGVCYIRPYVKPGQGVVHIRHDYYTHPSRVKEFERAGLLVGYTCEHQRPHKTGGQLRLMEPWKLVSMKIPQYAVSDAAEPMRLNNEMFDIDDDDYMNESPVETQNYGTSLVIRAYAPWVDLHEGLIAVNAARRNSSKVDRFVGVNTGKDNPTKAAQYFNAIANQFNKTSRDRAKQSLKKGYISTVDTKLYPISSTGSGRIEIQTETSPVDITTIADIDYHTSRLCAALGVDKSLMGYTDDMTGGLGEGGFFRMSILAAIKANLIRQAVLEGLENLFEIHVAAKHNKIYPDGQKPWRITFNSLNTAIEKEEADSRESRINFAASVAGLMQMLDQEMQTVNIPEFFNWMFTDLLKVDEEQFKAMINTAKAENLDKEYDDSAVMDSALNVENPELKNLIYKTITEVFAND